MNVLVLPIGDTNVAYCPDGSTVRIQFCTANCDVAAQKLCAYLKYVPDLPTFDGVYIP
jgi:hypothetical protein